MESHAEGTILARLIEASSSSSCTPRSGWSWEKSLDAGAVALAWCQEGIKLPTKRRKAPKMLTAGRQLRRQTKAAARRARFILLCCSFPRHIRYPAWDTANNVRPFELVH